MGTQGFFSLLDDVSRRNNSLLCIGLDPPLDMPVEDILSANRRIIDAAARVACAVKPNAAFYEARGAQGWEILQETITSCARQRAARHPGRQAGRHRLHRGRLRKGLL